MFRAVEAENVLMKKVRKTTITCALALLMAGVEVGLILRVKKIPVVILEIFLKT
jgi:hypothetical protein